MFRHQEKPKRHHQKKSGTRIFLIALIAIPAILFALQPNMGTSLLQEGIALSVMICSAVYIVHQAILGLIASYLGSPLENLSICDDHIIEGQSIE